MRDAAVFIPSQAPVWLTRPDNQTLGASHCETIGAMHGGDGSRSSARSKVRFSTRSQSAAWIRESAAGRLVGLVHLASKGGSPHG